MIALGSDHGGLALKRHVMEYLDARGLEYQDFGCYTAESCDYPDFGEAAARAVASGEYDRGIVICTTGIGISISANKVKGIRAALCGDCYSAEMTRRHNDANILAMGARVGGPRPPRPARPAGRLARPPQTQQTPRPPGGWPGFICPRLKPRCL